MPRSLPFPRPQIGRLGYPTKGQETDSGVVFSLRDEFSGTESAPITSPHICDRTGSVIVSQLTGNYSIGSGLMNIAAPNDGSDHAQLGFIDSTPYIRVSGLAQYTKFSFSENGGTAGLVSVWGWKDKISININIADGPRYGVAVRNFADAVYPIHSTQSIVLSGDSIVAGTQYEVMTVLRNAGFVVWIRGGSWVDWTLFYLTNLGTESVVYPLWSEGKAAGNKDRIAVANLQQFSNLWNTDISYLDNFINGPLSDGQVITHPNNFWLNWTQLIAPTTGDQIVSFRRVDEDNYFYFKIPVSPGTISLWKKKEGVDSLLANLSSYPSGFPRFGVHCQGSTIRTLVGGAYRNTRIDTDFQNATDFRVEVLQDAVMSNLEILTHEPNIAIKNDLNALVDAI